MTFSLKLTTAEESAAGDLAQAKAASLAEALQRLTTAASAVTGLVPQAERDSWATTAVAARAYLASFTGDAVGPMAPEALFELGAALGRLGQRDQACITLSEVNARFPGNDTVARAEAEMATLGCS